MASESFRGLAIISTTELVWVLGAAVVMLLVGLFFDYLPLSARLRKFLGGPDQDYPRPLAEEGEESIVEGRVEFQRGFFWSRHGTIILTNHRVLWYEDTWPGPMWPLKRISGQIRLSAIRSADKGTILDWIFGGARLRIRLGRWRSKCFFEPYGIDQWVTAIRQAACISKQGQGK